MDSSETLPIKQITVKINRGDEGTGDESVVLIFEELDRLEVALSDSTTADIAALFNAAFDYISSKKALIEFKLDDTENDLFNQVSQDIIDQLNTEIHDSEDNFVRIWQLAA